MTIDDIRALITSDESQTLELKKATGELKDGMHAACAFLNTEGGWLIFGITPQYLKIIGQQVTDDTQREIAQAIAGLQPAVDMRPEYIDVPDRPGHKVIAMHFDGWVWGDRPHTFHGRPYYKVESTTKVMPQDMYDERIRAFEPKTYSWELRQAEGVTLSDLNEKPIRGCIRLGVEGHFFDLLDAELAFCFKHLNLSGKMAEYLNMTKRGIQKTTNRLQESGVLSRKGSTKAGEWIVNQVIKQHSGLK